MSAASGSNAGRPATKKDMKRQLIMLKKDERDICRVRCSLHIELPSVWHITDFIPESILANLVECNHAHIYPSPTNDRQEKEWGCFLRYLRDRKKVAIARSEPYSLYVLPPAIDAILDRAKVAYVLEEVVATCGDQKHELSGSDLTTPRNILLPKVSNHSKKHRIPAPLPERAVSLDNVGKELLSPDSECTGKESAPNPNRASIHPSFLENLGRAHDWIFGAIAELVDNSRDAKASRLAIFVQNMYCKKAQTEIPVLSIMDDGCGMTHEEIGKMLSLGHKKLEKDFNRIGRFGTGFKTGAMRLGRDALVITQTEHSRSIAFLSQSLNEEKEILEIPIISYQRRGESMLLDTSIQSKSLAKYNMKAIKEFSPFDKFLIGAKIAGFGASTGTQIYIWNLDRWGSSYTLEWQGGDLGSGVSEGDITTRHRQVRTRPGQISRKVLLDYSLQAYLSVIFLDPRMKIYVQSSRVKTRPLAKFLSKTVIENGVILGKPVQLILGRCQLEWDQANCGIFLYWHGRLIEAYKRVGVMFYSADAARGLIGVIDVSTLMDCGENGTDYVHSNKQGFLDCEAHTELVDWLSSRVNAYCDNYIDPLLVEEEDSDLKPDEVWVQCEKCRKWRMLPSGYSSNSFSGEWFCYMKPFEGTCDTPQQEVQPGVVTVSTKRSGYEYNNRNNHSLPSDSSEDMLDRVMEEPSSRPLKRLRRRLPRNCNKK